MSASASVASPVFLRLNDSNSLVITHLKSGVTKTQVVKMFNQRLCKDNDDTQIVDCKISDNGNQAMVTFSCLEALDRAFEIANKLENGIYGMFDHTQLFYYCFY